MRKRNKTTLTAALALILLSQPLSPLADISTPMVVHAASSDDSGVSEWHTWASVKWGIDGNGTLWIEPLSGDTGETGDVAGEISGDKITKNTVPWYAKADSITSVRMKGTIKASVCSYMFAGLTNCTDIDLTNLDSSDSDKMSAMFANDEKLTTITGLDKLDTSKTTSMFGVFENCKSLPDSQLAQVADWDVSKVTNFDYMFNHVDSATTIPVGKWDTSSATDMFAMFENNRALTSLDVSGFKTGKVTDFGYMFANDDSLANLDVSKWDTSSATSMFAMFASDSSLTNLDVSGFRTGKVTDFGYMFTNDSGLTNLDVSKWDMSSATILDNIFGGCINLKTLDVSKWNTGNVKDFSLAFNNCNSLTNFDPSNWDVSNATNFQQIFQGCESITSLDLSKWNTGNVNDMQFAFGHMTNLTNLNVSTWNTANVKSMRHTFYDTKLTTLDLSNWSTNNTDTYGMLATSTLNKLILGKGFTSTDGNTSLPSPPLDSPYTGRWTKEDDTGTYGMSAEELMTLTGKPNDGAGHEIGDTLTADSRAGTWVWERGYRLVIDANGGFGGFGNSQSIIVPLRGEGGYDVSVDIPDPGFTREGYKENGVSENEDGTGAKYAFGDMITLTGNTVVYTNWLFDGYSVRYDANGGSGSMDSTKVAKGDSATVSTNTFTKDGYIFDDWNTKSDGSGTSYKNDDTFTPSGDTTLYAQWKGVDYSVAFSANGGSGSMSDESMTYGQEKALTANKFTRDTYDFVGWNTKPDGSGTSYKDGESVKNLTKSRGRTIKLYAQWKKSKWVSQGQDVSKTDDNTEHDSGSYILTIPTKIQFSGKIGKVDVSQAYKVNVTGNLPQDSYVHVNASAGDMSTNTLKLAVSQGKKIWTEADAWGSQQLDGSRSGSESNDKITLTGTAKSADAFTGSVTYTSSMSSSKYDDSTYGDFKITSKNKSMVETYEGSGIGGYTAGTTLGDNETNVRSRVWSIDGAIVGYNSATYTVKDSDLARGKSDGTFKSNKLTETITYNDGTKKTAYVYLAVPLTYTLGPMITLKRTLTDNGKTATELTKWQIPTGTISFKTADTFVPNDMELFAYPARATLISVDGTNIDTSNVVNMQDLFYQCSKIETIDVSGWNTSKVENIIFAFGYMSSLTSLPGIENWDTSNVTSCQATFYQSTKLHADLSKWNLDKADEGSRNGSFANDDPYVIQPNWRHKSVYGF